jgi:hypothetical protein
LDLQCQWTQISGALLPDLVSKNSQESTILLSEFQYFFPLVSQLNPEFSPKLDLSIEGMRSQQFSEWIFVFLMIGIGVFTAIVVSFMYSKNRSTEMRAGERFMFSVIIIGIIVAIILAVVQMLNGYLF